MKASIITSTFFFCLLTISISSAQDYHLDVEGHAKVRGNIDINHMNDTTSLFVGRNAGVDTEFSSPRFNTFVGSNTGAINTTGKDNSFFGQKAGFKNTMGERNSFFGLRAGGNNNTGNDNSFFGFDAGRDNTTGGERNSFFGKSAGLRNISGIRNSFYGFDAGLTNTTGTRNTFIGYGADQSNSDSLDRATAIGYQAKVNCSNCLVLGGTGPDSVHVGIGTDTPEKTLDIVGNTKIRGHIDINEINDTTTVLIGRNAGVSTNYSEQRFVTILGSEAGKSNITGTFSSFFGAAAGKNNTFGTTNSFFGESAGSSNTMGSGNSFFGRMAGKENIIGNFNSFFGKDAGMSNTSGSNNSFFGLNAGLENTSGFQNAFFGGFAGLRNTTGTRNTFLGYFAKQLTDGDSLDRAIAIGYNARVDCDKCAVIGGTGDDAVKVGIGISAPSDPLSFNNETGTKINLFDDEIGIYGFGIAPAELQIGTYDNTKHISLGHYSGASKNFVEWMRVASDGNVGVGINTPTHILHVNGVARSTQSTWATSSDARIKKNIVEIEDARNLLDRFRAITFNWSEEYGMPTDQKQYGFIAQEVEQIIPEMVSKVEEKVGDKINNDFRILNTSALTPILVKAFQELAERNDHLADLVNLQQAEIGILKQEMEAIKRLLNTQINDGADEE